MPVHQSLDASLRATANGAFIGASGQICSMVNEGDELSHALRTSDLFPEDFLQMVTVAETSGTVPEMLHRMSPQFADQARRSLSALTSAMAWLVWAIVAAIIIFMIFRLAFFYINQITQALP